MAGVRRVGLEDAVRSGIVASGIHGVGSRLVERCREPHVAGAEARDCDFSHCGDLLGDDRWSGLGVNGVPL